MVLKELDPDLVKAREKERLRRDRNDCPGPTHVHLISSVGLCGQARIPGKPHPSDTRKSDRSAFRWASQTGYDRVLWDLQRSCRADPREVNILIINAQPSDYGHPLSACGEGAGGWGALEPGASTILVITARSTVS